MTDEHTDPTPPSFYGMPVLEAPYQSPQKRVLVADVPGWHAGQPYEEKPAVGLRCLLCGGTTFEVAQGSYWTGVRCVVCRYEVCIHEG